MSIFTVEGRTFAIIVASDTDFDGLAWKLWEYMSPRSSDDKIFLLQIIRHDDQRRIEFKTIKSFSVPIETFETLLSSFDETGGREFDDSVYEE